MAIVTMEDLLNRAAEFERKLVEFFADIRDKSEDNGVRLLTYYLARHRNHLDQALEVLESDGVLRVRRVQVKYDIDFQPDKALKLVEMEPTTVKADELLNSAIAYDEQLIRLYRSILEQPVGEEAKALLEALVRIEERDVVMLKKMLAMNYF